MACSVKKAATTNKTTTKKAAAKKEKKTAKYIQGSQLPLYLFFASPAPEN
jgi:hypothetical protein